MNPHGPSDLRNLLVVYSFYDHLAQAHYEWTEHPVTALSSPAGPTTFTATFSETHHLFTASWKVERVHLPAANQLEPLILFQLDHPLTKEDCLSLGPTTCFHCFAEHIPYASRARESMQAIGSQSRCNSFIRRSIHLVAKFILLFT